MILKRKSIIWLLCSIPLWITAARVFPFSPHSAKFWSRALGVCGYSAAVLLAICLIVSPLHKSFPSIQVFSHLNRRKKELGLSAFFYAFLHASSFFIKKNISKGSLPWEYLLHPVIIPGLIALIILLVLALTSDDYWIKKLTWKKWKSIHRTVYLAQAAVFLHMAFQGGKVLVWGCLIFIPLFIFQRLRFKGLRKNEIFRQNPYQK